jgi:accessory Sec system S-layer assembly protein
MFNIFKSKKINEKLEGVEDTVSSKQLFGTEEGADHEKIVETTLSLHPNWKLPVDETYVYQFLNNECPPMHGDQVSIYGIRMIKREDSYQITAFVRNGTKKKLKLKRMPFLLLAQDGTRIGEKLFELEQLGEIPPQSSRPWHFSFKQEDLLVNEIPQEGWKLAFNLNYQPKKKNVLEFHESWANELTKEQKQQLVNKVENAPEPRPGQINFMGIDAKLENNQLVVTMLIRNGAHKDINLQKLPLKVQDASGDVVASGIFELGSFHVRANTSKPWKFIFPAQTIKKDDIDLTSWNAIPSK